MIVEKYSPNKNSFLCSLMNCHYIRFPIEYFLEKTSYYGFSQIELFGAIPHFYIEDVDTELCKKILSLCRRYSVSIKSFTPAQSLYPYSISISELKPRRRSIEMLKKGIQFCAKLGAASMLVNPGFGYETDSVDLRWGLCRDALIELGEYASQAGIVLTIEPLTPMTSNVINTSAQCAKMLREIRLPSIKGMLDIGVMNYMKETVNQYFDELGDNIRLIHFTDGPGAHVALGDGRFPMANYAKEIISNHYYGMWSLEINDKRYLSNPDSAIEKSVKWLRKNGYSD